MEWLLRAAGDQAQKFVGRGDPNRRATTYLPTAAHYQELDQNVTPAAQEYWRRRTEQGSAPQQEPRPYYQPQTTAGRYAHTIGEFAPGALFPGGPVQRALLNVAAPAVASEAAGQAAEGTGWEPHARVAGALLGSMAPSAAARLITPIPARSVEHTRQARILAGEGVDTTAGQATGSPALRGAEAHLGNLPGAGRRATEITERQGEQFTRAALTRTGTDAPRATSEVMDQAFTRLGQQFDDLAARNTINLDRGVKADVLSAMADYNRLVPDAMRSAVVPRLVSDIFNAGNRMDGAAYQSWRSQMERAARGAQSNPPLADALRDMRMALDDAMQRSVSATDSAAWREARGQYRNLLAIERAVAGAGEATAEGLASPSQLRTAVIGQNRRSYVRGQSDLAELSRAGEAVLKPLPQSGTPWRTAPQTILSGIGAAGGALAGGPPAAAVGAVAGALLPSAVGRALMSRPAQAWLGNQVLPYRFTPLRTGSVAAALAGVH